MHALWTWLEERTGLPGTLQRFFSEVIPESAGWPQVFGSVVLFLFLLQSLTGILLSFNFAPTPGDAYRSLAYIVREVAGGHMMRNLHHWGASLMIIVLFAHMAQVFIFGAYHRPREATWISGIVLMLFTLAFGLTGYLLPWDNRAYWGTVVTTRIMASIPLIGALLLRVAGAPAGVGVVTFSRFYSLHTIVLPVAALSLIGFHVLLVKRHGVTPAGADDRNNQTFYPRQAWRDLLAVFAAFAILFLAGAFLDVPLERIADPTDASYVPRPEWYFLSLFEVLKLLDGPLQLLGSVVLPAAAIVLLFALPFLRARGARLILSKRVAAAIGASTFLLWGTLTWAAYEESPRPNRPSNVTTRELDWALLMPEQIAGKGYFSSSGCASCHGLLGSEGKGGPSLSASSVHHPKEWLAQHFTHPPAAPEPKRLSIPQLNALSMFLGSLNQDSMVALDNVTPQFVHGAQLYVSGACASCHRVNGEGGGIGPPLNGLADRRSKEWVRTHFMAPQKLSPGSIMPPYPFNKEEQDAILLYLFSLPE